MEVEYGSNEENKNIEDKFTEAVYSEIYEKSVHFTEEKVSHSAHKAPVHIELDLSEKEFKVKE